MKISKMIIENKKAIYLLSVASGLFVLAYYPAIRILIELWITSEEYSHAFLTVPIIGYMIWSKRSSIVDMRKDNRTLGIFLAVISTICYCLALLTKVNTIILLSMYFTVLGVVIQFFGTGVIRQFATPLILAALLIPIPDQLYIKLTFPLQLKVSQATELIVRMVGIPILREGNIMITPGKSFEVVEACSGLRSVITLLTLSIIMGYYMLKRITLKLSMALSSIFIAIIVNIFRVSIMILIFHYFQIDLSAGTYHTITGLSVFVIAFLSLISLQKVLEKWEIN